MSFKDDGFWTPSQYEIEQGDREGVMNAIYDLRELVQKVIFYLRIIALAFIAIAIKFYV